MLEDFGGRPSIGSRPELTRRDRNRVNRCTKIASGAIEAGEYVFQVGMHSLMVTRLDAGQA
jgi:hypothetical protein